MAGSQQGWRSVGSGGGGGGSVISVTASAPVVSSGGANPNISMAKADSTTNGYLSASDWTAFNNKLSSAFNQQIQDEGNNVPQRNVINFVGNGVSVTDTGGKTQVSITSGQGNSIYYLNLSVSEAPYSQFSSNPVSGSQQSVTANISGSATSTIASFQTPIGIPNTTNLIGGLWTFFLHFGTSSSSTDFTIYVEVYKRTNAGIETLILTTDSFTTSTLSSTPVMILTDGVLPNTTLLTTDRIVVKVVVVNNKSSSHNITFYTEGTTNYSVSYTTLGQSIPSGAVTNVTASSPLTSSGGTTPNLAIPQANGSTNGFLSSGDWTTFNNKQNTITGGASTITTSNLSPSFALQSNTSGKVEVSTVTSTELGYVSGVTSSIQTQLNNKQNTLVNPVTGTGASGQVSFWSGTNTQSGSNNFFWDNTNGRLGIGTTTPDSPLNITRGNSALSGVGRIVNIASTLTASANNDVLVGLDINPTFTAGAFTGTTQIALRLFGGTTSWFGTQFTNGGIRCNTNLGGSGGISFDSSLPVGNRLNFNNNFTIRSNSAVTSGTDISLFTNSVINTTNTVSLVGISGNVFSSAGGNNQTNGLLISPTINLVASNVATTFRGIHYNPTLTSQIGLTHRAIETTSGDVLFGSNFFWDNTNNALGLGGSPLSTSRLNIIAKDNLNTSQSLRIQASTGGTTQFEVTGDGKVGIGGGINTSFTLNVVGTSRFTDDISLIKANQRLTFTGGTTSGGLIGLNGTFRISGQGSGTSTDYTSIALVNVGDISSGNTTATSGTINLVAVGSNSYGNQVAPTSGNLTYNTLVINTGINTTGTYSGIIRGLYYNPTIVSAIGVTNRAIETTSGDVLFGSNFIWNNANGNLALGGTASSNDRLYVKATTTSATDFAIRVQESLANTNIFTINNAGSLTMRNRALTGEFTLGFSDNNTLSFGLTAIGTFMTVGSTTPSNVVTFGVQQIQSNVRGARFSSTDGNTPSTVTIAGIPPLSSGTTPLNSLLINPAINNTGTYVGTVRGLYYNPTLTSLTGTTHRAIETATGDVIFNSTTTNIGNVAIGGTSFGTSANRVLAVYNGTAPASSTLTSFQMYSADISGSGTASPHFRTENGNTIKLYQETAVTTAQGIANALTNLGVLASSTIPQSGYTLIFGHSSATFLANNTYDIGALTYLPPTNATSNSISRRFRVPKTGIVKRVSILTVCANQSSLSPSPTLRLNNFTTLTATTITTTNLYNNGGAGAFARNNVFSPSGGIAVTEGDEINIQSVIPNWTTAPQIDNFILTLWIEET